jgi:hypothetical protein
VRNLKPHENEQMVLFSDYSDYRVEVESDNEFEDDWDYEM